jgi:hypothetical protein
MDISDYNGDEYVVFISVFTYPFSDDGREGSGGGNIISSFNFDSTDGSSSLYQWTRYDIATVDVCS